jgi:hypothetical protein
MTNLICLNDKTTAILIRLTSPENYGWLENPPFKTLFIRQHEDDVESPWGSGSIYGLAQTYEAYDETVYLPEMSFFILRRPTNPNEMAPLSVVPLTLDNDELEFQRKAVTYEDCKIVDFDPAEMETFASFANTWLAQLESQGYLRNLPK